ncbi:tripartite tricarboxylate transporter TctB family protein [Thalassospiraceae bacterium LMO-JJ14]|nr:tripartite tricarboxylate transporter TctB family protein [Thalassospiraceae bacterium LMO-JJ14]
MQSEKFKEILLGTFVLGIGIVGFVFVNPTDAPVTEGPGGVSWRTVPFIYSGLLMALAVVFLAITVIRGPIPVDEVTAEEAVAEAEEEALEAAAPHPTLFGIQISTLRRIAVIAALIVYSQAMNAYGFAIATPVFLFFVLYVFGRTKLVENLLVSIVGSFALWTLFAHLLKMPLTGHTWDPLTPALSAALRSLGV